MAATPLRSDQTADYLREWHWPTRLPSIRCAGPPRQPRRESGPSRSTPSVLAPVMDRHTRQFVKPECPTAAGSASPVAAEQARWSLGFAPQVAAEVEGCIDPAI